MGNEEKLRKRILEIIGKFGEIKGIHADSITDFILESVKANPLETIDRDVCEWKEKPNESWIWITSCGHEVEDDDTTRGELYCRWCGDSIKLDNMQTA